MISYKSIYDFFWIWTYERFGVESTNFGYLRSAHWSDKNLNLKHIFSTTSMPFPSDINVDQTICENLFYFQYQDGIIASFVKT